MIMIMIITTIVLLLLLIIILTIMYLNSVLPPYTCIHVQMRFTIKFVNKRSDF